MMKMRSMLLATAAAMIATTSYAADQQLSGQINSAAGQRLDGVTVSAKMAGSTITTSVYTDEQGMYYFPAMPEGQYQVWAQALGFERANADVNLNGTKRQNLSLQTITDPEARWRQLPGELVMAALPEENAEDVHMKQIFNNNCNGCHVPSYPLQFKFDQQGWSRVIDLMKVIGGGLPQDRPANQIMQMNQQRLAAYLAKVRGPNSGAPKIVERPRPSGEAARVVWQLYDVERVPATGARFLPAEHATADNDGTNWVRGTPSKAGLIVHDGAMDFDGNVWFTSNSTNPLVTAGKVDTKTGEVTYRKLNRNDGSGRAAGAHGIARDGDGNLWIDVNPGRRSLAKVDPKGTGMQVFPTQDPMAPLGGAVTIDVDGKGMIWASAPRGVLRFDPKTFEYTEFKSKQPVRPYGTGGTYGAAGDRNGNGWWAEMAFDTIGKANVATGTVDEIVLPENRRIRDFLTPQEVEAYMKVTDISTGNPYPWAQGPRRMGTDKNADILWTSNSWGSSLGRIDTNTNAVQIIPFPERSMQGYHLHVDSQHNVWGNLWTNDRLFKYDSVNNKWTLFEFPVRGTENRHIFVDERSGRTKITTPVYRNNQMAVMTVRTEADINALKQRAELK
jgi:streptogramin lyase/mono/diheme cytochrome c family protein